MDLDLTTMAGIGAGTTLLVEGLKNKFPKLVSGRETVLALALPVAFAVVSKHFGYGFADASWLNLVVGSVLVGLGAGVAHDKALPVATRLVGRVFGLVRGWVK